MKKCDGMPFDGVPGFPPDEHAQDLPAEVPLSMLVSEISKLFHYTVRISMESRGVSAGAMRILFHLSHHDGITQRRIVELAHLSAPTVSVTLTKMEAQGLLSRSCSSTDMRETLVYLTEKGREYSALMRETLRAGDAAMIRGMQPEDVARLREGLQTIRKNLLGDIQNTVGEGDSK